MKSLNRWVLLEHSGAPDDPKGIHFDLLIEDLLYCRSWRLTKILELDGPVVGVTPIVPHNLSWLETSGREVSGGRGWACPIKSGVFTGTLPPEQEETLFEIKLLGNDLNGCLKMYDKYCVLRS